MEQSASFFGVWIPENFPNSHFRDIVIWWDVGYCAV